ncbi:prephenate dehydrogenase [Streptomyces fenghuangensis]|uniref:Prephenate dehydrogenase n=1 Tax=Streptomyces chitinivorans TaxID=1257027 RepID=A0ABW7I249_9ACTN|nr:prephenate dehydrogenase [Streptomyces chitinivorans]MDH2412474.1 prephenate dehydrogenase [Streptomyces chitinivorans]
MIRTLAIVGAGLIGTSIGLAMSRHGMTVHLMDRDTSAARTAAALGAGVVGAPAEKVDLAVIAVPPHAVADVLAEQQARGLARSYTDVASVKALPVQRVGDSDCYVGGHPMAGRERSGPLAARADLFEDRTWVLTPSAETSQTALNHALELVALCGAVPLVMNCEVHDRAVALTSHAPHVVASLMAARLQHGPQEALRLVGQGLRDVTRIAGGDAHLWADILRSNAGPVARVLREVERDLAVLLTALEDLAGGGEPHGPSMRRMVDLLERGVAGLSAVRPAHALRPAGRRLTVPVEEKPGELTRLLDTLAEHGVGPDDVTTRVDVERDRMNVEFAVPAATAELLCHRLAEKGWHAEDMSARPRRARPQQARISRPWNEEAVPTARAASLPGVS